MFKHRRRRRFDLSKAIFILPNLFTLSSIFCGFYALVTVVDAQPDEMNSAVYRACLAVIFAMVFDAVDGRVARLTRTQSDFGVQMDSLADVTSFGVVPAMIAWRWGLDQFGNFGLFVCFAFAACGTIRLARFNVMAASDSGPSRFFLGLPIPAAAGVLVAVMITSSLRSRPLEATDSWSLGLMLMLSALMVSNVRFRTFKATRATKRVYLSIFAVLGMVTFIVLRTDPAMGILALMGSYLAFGIAEEAVRQVRRLFEDQDVPEEDVFVADPTFDLLVEDRGTGEDEEELID